MPSVDGPTGKSTDQHRRYSSSANGLTLSQTKTRHDFQARGSAKHLERLESAREKGDYGVALSVCHPYHII